jgi:hypothetical protein
MEENKESGQRRKVSKRMKETRCVSLLLSV